MKPYLTLTLLITLLAYKATAQRLIDPKDGMKHVGKHVRLFEQVTDAKGFSADLAYVIVGRGSGTRNVMVIMKGKDAKRKALFMRGKWVMTEGLTSLFLGDQL